MEAKDRILNESIKLFAKKSFHGTGVREIAKNADVKISMISYYFGSKVGILEYICNDFFEYYSSAIVKELDNPKDIDELFDKVIHKIVEIILQDPEKFKVAITENPYDVESIVNIKSIHLKKIIEAVQFNINRFSKTKKELIKFEIIGPFILSSVFSHFLLKPIISKVINRDFDENFYKEYPKYIKELLLNGFNGILNV